MSARRERARAMPGRAALLILALVLAAAPVNLLVADGAGMVLMLIAAVCVVGAGTALRALRVPPGAVPIGQVLVLLALLRVAEHRTGALPYGSSEGTIAAQRNVFEEGVRLLGGSYPPVALEGAASVVVLLLLALTALVLDLLVLDLDRPGPAGLLLAALALVPALNFPEGGPWWAVAGPVAAGLLILGLPPRSATPRALPPSAPHDAAPARAFSPRATPSAGRAGRVPVLAGLMALVLALGPALAGALPVRDPAPYPLSLDALRSGAVGPAALGGVMIADSVSIRRDLLRGQEQELLRYTTDAEEPDYLRLRALADYENGQFVTGSDGGTPSFSDVRLGEDAGEEPIGYRLEVTGPLVSNRLPAPSAVRSLTAQGTPALDDSGAEEGELRLASRPRSLTGASYELTVARAPYDEEQLRAVPQVVMGQPLADGAVTADVPSVVSDLAQQIRADADAQTGYDMARALEQYFQQNFTYDLEARTPEGEDPVASFLRDRTGYCEQYAATFALMMDSLGYSSRVVIGFTSGSVDGEEHVVTNHNAHAWPEVWFGADLGWVRFEPTPAAATANGVSTPEYAAPAEPEAAPEQSASEPAVEPITADAEAPDSASEDPATTTAVPATTAGPTAGRGGAGALRGLGLVALLAMIAGGGAVLRRREDRARALRWERADGSAAPELAWQELSAALAARRRGIRLLGWTGWWGRPPARFALDPSLPPREALGDLLEQAEAAGIGVGAEDADAAARLGEALTLLRYAPAGTEVLPRITRADADRLRRLARSRPRRSGRNGAGREGTGRDGAARNGAARD